MSLNVRAMKIWVYNSPKLITSNMSRNEVFSWCLPSCIMELHWPIDSQAHNMGTLQWTWHCTLQTWLMLDKKLHLRLVTIVSYDLGIFFTVHSFLLSLKLSGGLTGKKILENFPTNRCSAWMFQISASLHHVVLNCSISKIELLTSVS